jgi:hypothetical protein
MTLRLFCLMVGLILRPLLFNSLSSFYLCQLPSQLYDGLLSMA